VGAHLLEPLPEPGLEGVEPAPRPLAALELQERLGSPVQRQDRPPAVEDQHRVGQAVDGRLRRLLRLEQVAERALSVLLEPVGHHVELAAQLRDLVLSVGPGPGFEVPLAEAAHRQGQGGEGAHHAGGDRHRGEQAEHQRRQRPGQEELEVALRGAARLVALAHDGVLVQVEDLPGGRPDALRGHLDLPPVRVEGPGRRGGEGERLAVGLPGGPQARRQLGLTALGDVPLLHAELRLEAPRGIAAGPPGLAQRAVQGGPVELLERSQHPLRGEDAPVVVLEDVLGALSQGGGGPKGGGPEQDQRRPEGRLGEQEAAAERHRVSSSKETMWRSSPEALSTSR
jgi:hypothetical protein